MIDATMLCMFFRLPRSFRFFCAVLWMIFIFILSSQPVLPGTSVVAADFLSKKIAHMAVFGVLYYLWYLTLNEAKDKKNFLVPAIIVIVYAITDELHQSIIPGRRASFGDVGYDSIGAGIVFLKLKGLI
jgi:VanZ family protein